MAISYKLTITDPRRGIIVSEIPEADMLRFMNPGDDSEVLLEVSRNRADEICKWSTTRQLKMRLKLERREFHLAKEYVAELMQTEDCPFCKAMVTVIDVDFHLHSIPWCLNWRRYSKYV